MIPTTTASLPAALLPESLLRLLRSRVPGKNLAVALLGSHSLTSDEKYEAERWLSSAEMRQLQKYSFEKRRSDWLSGRICAKQAVLGLLSGQMAAEELQPHEIVIDSNPSGRPFLQLSSLPAAASTIDISITHSHGLAAAVAGLGFCGIDIQHLNNTLFRVKHRFCTTIEAARLAALSADELEQLGLLWVAKEAVRKCLSSARLPGFHEIELDSVSEEQGYHLLDFVLQHPFGDAGPISVVCHYSDLFAIAFCVIPRKRLYAGTT